MKPTAEPDTFGSERTMTPTERPLARSSRTTEGPDVSQQERHPEVDTDEKIPSREMWAERSPQQERMAKKAARRREQVDEALRAYRALVSESMESVPRGHPDESKRSRVHLLYSVKSLYGTVPSSTMVSLSGTGPSGGSLPSAGPPGSSTTMRPTISSDLCGMQK